MVVKMKQAMKAVQKFGPARIQSPVKHHLVSSEETDQMQQIRMNKFLKSTLPGPRRHNLTSVLHHNDPFGITEDSAYRPGTSLFSPANESKRLPQPEPNKTPNTSQFTRRRRTLQAAHLTEMSEAPKL